MVEHGSPDAHEQKGGDSLKSKTQEELITARRLPQSLPPSTSQLPCATSPSSPSFSSPMSPPPYSPLQGPHSRKHNWHPKEDEYLRYLMERDLTWSQRHVKFQGRFGAHRSMKSLSNRCKTHLQGGCPSFLSRKQKDWTSGEIQYLRTLLETERNWDDVAQKLEEKFNNGRSLVAIKQRVQMCKMNTSRFNREPWTAEQDDYLEVLKTHGIPYKEWAGSFRGKFGFQRTEGALKTRHNTLGLNTEISDAVHWTDDEEKFITELMPYNLRHIEICDRFWKIFGTERSQFSINRKYQIMKRSPDHGEPSSAMKQRWWDSDEDRFVMEWSGRLMDLFPAFSKKFGTHRTKVALTDKYYMRQRRKGRLAT